MIYFCKLDEEKRLVSIAEQVIESEQNFTPLELTSEEFLQAVSGLGRNKVAEINGVNKLIVCPPSEAELAAEEEFERVARIATLRARREKECFTIINRGQMWYEMLDEMQKQDLRDWYRQWLDVTVTQVVPNKPYWLKD